MFYLCILFIIFYLLLKIILHLYFVNLSLSLYIFMYWIIQTRCCHIILFIDDYSRLRNEDVRHDRTGETAKIS